MHAVLFTKILFFFIFIIIFNHLSIKQSNFMKPYEMDIETILICSFILMPLDVTK